jgi:hypothetical protein
MNVVRSIGVIGLACALGAAAADAQAPPKPQISDATKARAAETKANPDALVLQDFNARIAAYMAIEKAAAKDSLPIEQSKSSGEIKAAQLALAEHIRAARASAKPGDILTPEIRNKFRRLMYPDVTGTSGRKTREALREDVHETDEGRPKKIVMKVNAAYPSGNALPTTPANVLASLPKLPEQLEYRIVDKDLILRDAQANIIVDFILNAIQ